MKTKQVMKATITLEFETEGDAPDTEIVKDAIARQIPQAILSETIDGTNAWALLIESIQVDITP